MTETPVMDRPANATEEAQKETAQPDTESPETEGAEGDTHDRGECSCYPAKLTISATRAENGQVEFAVDTEGCLQDPEIARRALVIADGLLKEQQIKEHDEAIAALAKDLLRRFLLP